MIEQIIAYRVGDEIFDNVVDAENYQSRISNIIDKTTKYDFEINDIVYVCIRDRLRECTVIREEFRVELEWDNKTQTSLNVRTNFLVLKDNHDENESEIAIFDEFQAKNVKYYWSELLNFDIEKFK